MIGVSPIEAPPPEIVGSPEVQALVQQMSQRTQVITREIAKAIVGQREIVLDVLTAIISRGHVLLIGMPGRRHPFPALRCASTDIALDHLPHGKSVRQQRRVVRGYKNDWAPAHGASRGPVSSAPTA